MQVSKFITLATSENPTEIEKMGGTGFWRLKPANVHAAEYAVLCAHGRCRDNLVHDFLGIEPYEAFRIGRISGLTGREGRYRIMIDQAADISVKDAWPKGARFAFTYDLPTENLRNSLDLEVLEWRQVPAGTFA